MFGPVRTYVDISAMPHVAAVPQRRHLNKPLRISPSHTRAAESHAVTQHIKHIFYEFPHLGKQYIVSIRNLRTSNTKMSSPRFGKTALVTGANGITGYAIIDHLVRQPKDEW
jgi:hypothetical protein